VRAGTHPARQRRARDPYRRGRRAREARRREGRGLRPGRARGAVRGDPPRPLRAGPGRRPAGTIDQAHRVRRRSVRVPLRHDGQSGGRLALTRTRPKPGLRRGGSLARLPGLANRPALMLSRSLRFLLLLLLFAAHAASFAADGRQGGHDAYEAIVLRVQDGDTLLVRRIGQTRPHRVRLSGIDAPERGQAHADESRAALEALVAGKRVRVAPVKKDPWGRVVAAVSVGER